MLMLRFYENILIESFDNACVEIFHSTEVKIFFWLKAVDWDGKSSFDVGLFIKLVCFA